MLLLYPFDLSVTLLGGRVAVVVLLAAAAARRRMFTPRYFQRLQPFLKVVETMHQLHAHSLPKRIQFRQRLLVPLLCDYISFFASPFPLLRDIFDVLVRFSRALFVDFFHQMHHLRERFQFFLIIVMMCFHFVFFAVMVVTVITTARKSRSPRRARRECVVKLVKFSLINVCVYVCAPARQHLIIVRNIFEISLLFLTFYSYAALSRVIVRR